MKKPCCCAVCPERMTSQKKIILDYLKKVKTHPSAEAVYKEAKKSLPNISQGTVYRILNNLKEKNEVQIIASKGIAYFDGDISSHAHFICTKCDKIYDVFDECSKCGILDKKRVKVGKINHYKIHFYGICKQCF